MKYLILFFAGMISMDVNASEYNIITFGAVADGKTVCTKAIQSAIDKGSENGDKVIIPAGSFVTGTLFLKNNTALVLEKNARLLGSADLADYPKTKVNFRFWGDTWTYQSLIVAHNVDNITIEGQGTIDGRGSAFPVTTTKKPDRYRNRPYLLWIAECKNVTVRDIELRNSAMWMQSYIRCEKLRIDGIKVFNHSNKNNDLMDIDGCKDVIITRVTGDSDDDGITFKSTTDRIAENIIVSDCIISSHCNALKFGTETTSGFRNVSISNCIIRRSSVTTALTGLPEGICGISLEIVDGGIMENIVLSNIVIDGTHVPLFVRLGNRARRYYDGAPDPPLGSVRNIVLTNIVAQASGPVGCSITGIPESKIDGITLSDSRFIYPGGIKDDLSKKKVEELRELYPESTMFGTLPASGLYIRHVNNLNLHGVSFGFRSPDSRPSVICDDVNGGSIHSVSMNGVTDYNEIKIFDNSTIQLIK
ncbi:MAG: glycosyl hydrolase family 28 protein [Prolixibacteraceae bacterium]